MPNTQERVHDFSCPLGMSIRFLDEAQGLMTVVMLVGDTNKVYSDSVALSKLNAYTNIFITR